MTITIEIQEEIARRAAARGLSVEEYIEDVLARELERPELPEPKGYMTNEELEAWFDRLAKFSDKVPMLPTSAFSRESIYQDHD
jgi:hypothetical protein